MRATPLAVVALAAALAITGCSTPKDFYATGGSRADGTVDMAYDIRQFEDPVVNMNQAQTIARNKCRVWGYQDAEPFGGKQQTCHQFNGYGTCIAGQVIIKYQCLGNGNPVTTFSAAPAPTPATSTPPGALSREQWKQQQLQRLESESGLSYEEYQRRYRAIVAQ